MKATSEQKKYIREDLSILPKHQFDNVKQDKDRIFFFTEGRCGTHWVLYILAYFTQRPIATENFYYHFCDLPTNFEKPFIHHLHDADFFFKNFKPYFPYLDFEEDKFITIIRNPLEKLLRTSMSVKRDPDSLIQDRYEMWLPNNMKYYEKFSQKNRYLFYYEDLITNPKEEIRKLLTFLTISPDKLNDFIENFEFHKTNCLKHYDVVQKSYTQGKDIDFYSKKYPPKEVKKLVKHLKSANPKTWKMYLTRYDLKPSKRNILSRINNLLKKT